MKAVLDTAPADSDSVSDWIPLVAACHYRSEDHWQSCNHAWNPTTNRYDLLTCGMSFVIKRCFAVTLAEDQLVVQGLALGVDKIC